MRTSAGLRRSGSSDRCRPPQHANYALGALNGIWPPFDTAEHLRRLDRGQTPLPEPNLVDLLLAERDWLGTGFWRLFEADGTGEVSLANSEKYGKGRQTWTDALLELSRRGVLPRERLLDATLAALSRDFIQFRAGWFSRFHDALQPTPDECAQRSDAYLRLLASSIPPTVACALKALVLADGAKPLPAARLISALQPVLSAPSQAAAKTAVEFLDRVANREPSVRSQACLAVASALLHEAIEIQRAALEVLDRHGDRQDASLRAKVGEGVEAVAASLRRRLVPWLEGPAPTRRAGEPLTPHVSPVPQVPVSRLDPARHVKPITDLDNLILAASAALEEPANPTDLECILDGISRLRDRRPGDFPKLTGPLRKRALKKRDDRNGRWPRHSPLERALAMTILSWLDGDGRFTETPEGLAHGQNQYAFLFRRLVVLATPIPGGHALPLLSAPTHLGGWIAPAALVDRWLTWQKAGLEPDEHEQVLALLRLAPEERAAGLGAAAAIRGEAGAALRFALGQEVELGRNAALWLAACRNRQPHGDLPEYESRHPKRGPDAGLAARYSWRAWSERHRSASSEWTSLGFELQATPTPPREVPDTLLPVLHHGPWKTSEEGEKNLMRWGALLWPANREALFARGARRLENSVEYADVLDREFAAYLEPLTDPFTELRPMACLALALGLAAQDSALRGHAQEGLIAAITDGRLDKSELGAAMARLLETGFNKFARWAKALREVARVSSVHAGVAADLIQLALHGDARKAPRDLAMLLEVLVELLSESGRRLGDRTALEYLASLAVGGKTARLVNQLRAG